MSHFSELKTSLKNRTVIEKALARMGYTVESAAQGVEARGFMGDKQRVDFKALTAIHYDIGFKKDEHGEYEIVADWEVLPKATGTQADTFLKQLKREYARETILELAAERGLTVSCNENEETIEMVVTQW